ncbi:MAG: hypothetical protein DRP45_00955 [Candidatus Zixiibacteriota bacterium]|nr:MAG: hypothetical protein DRP45_00955 [candidate division Zixibacteria bacterium]
MGAVMGIIGGVLGAAGSIQAGREQAAISNAQATWKDYEAGVAEQNAEYAVYMHARDTQKVMGAQKAAYAASGVKVDTGSPLDVMDETSRIAEAEQYNIRREGQQKSAALKGEAGLLRMGAQSQITGSTLSGASQAFSSFSKVGGSN